MFCKPHPYLYVLQPPPLFTCFTTPTPIYMFYNTPPPPLPVAAPSDRPRLGDAQARPASPSPSPDAKVLLILQTLFAFPSPGGVPSPPLPSPEGVPSPPIPAPEGVPSPPLPSAEGVPSPPHTTEGTLMRLAAGVAGSYLTLQGPGAYDAAVHCASVSAARRNMQALNRTQSAPVQGSVGSRYNDDYLSRTLHRPPQSEPASGSSTPTQRCDHPFLKPLRKVYFFAKKFVPSVARTHPEGVSGL
jgi:hypothetical protein